MSEDKHQEMRDRSENDSDVYVNEISAETSKKFAEFLAQAARESLQAESFIPLPLPTITWTTDSKNSGVDEKQTLNTRDESEYAAEVDEIFTQLHDADRNIAETRKNTVRLGIETRSMLDDLRKQLG